MNKFPPYNPQAKCPKCGHDDVHTAYVKSGGRYGEPCFCAPSEWVEKEHIHRYCRRCSAAWCESCVDEQRPASDDIIRYRITVAHLPLLDGPHRGELIWQADLADEQGLIKGNCAGWDTTPEKAVIHLFLNMVDAR